MSWATTVARLAPATAAEAARRWGRDPQSLVPVSRGVNLVFRGDGLYLRLVHATLRGEEFLAPPVSFLRHAFEHDLARAVLELGVSERRRLQSHLIAGYREAMPLAQEWIDAMPILRAARAPLMCAWTLEDDPGTEPPASGSGSASKVSFSRLRSRLRERMLAE